MGLILSSDTFETFSLMFIEKISGINPVSTSAVIECHCQIQNSAFSRDLAVVKHESETRAHIMMKNTKNTYVFALRKISSVGTYFLMSLVKQ